MQRLIWMCLESWKLDYPTFSYKWTLRACLEVLAGERSYSYTLDRRQVLLYSGKVVLFNWARSFWRDAHGAVREEGDTCLASQISRINPGDQWGDRCRSQIALTSRCLSLWDYGVNYIQTTTICKKKHIFATCGLSLWWYTLFRWLFLTLWV